jgi:hypothetical protein
MSRLHSATAERRSVTNAQRIRDHIKEAGGSGGVGAGTSGTSDLMSSFIKRSFFVPGICHQLLQAVQINDAGQELSADYNARCTSKVQCMGFRVVARK